MARDEALAAVSHDLRTPLTAIKTSAGTLRDESLLLPLPVRVQLLANIEADADRLMRFVSAALALNRLERSVAPQREWNALGEVASAALDRMAPLLGDRPVHFSIPDTMPLMQFDAWLIDQALGNLLENAAVHTPPGTPVTVDARLEGQDLKLVVADSGRGFRLKRASASSRNSSACRWTSLGRGWGCRLRARRSWRRAGSCGWTRTRAAGRASSCRCLGY